MKKLLFSVIAVLMSLIVSVAVLSGCNLVTVDDERDMAQVVATVKISDDAPMAEIKKKEMVTAYLNYGYYYANSYSTKQIFELIINNLVNTRIIIQNTINEFDAAGKVEHSDKDKWDIERYLSDEEIIKAKYNTVKTMNDLIDSYASESSNKKSDTYGETVRTVPQDAKNADDEKTYEEMRVYVAAYETNGADIGTVGSERYKAYNKVLKMLETNGLLGGDNVTAIKDTLYFSDTLTINKENILVDKYRENVQKEARESVKFDELVSEYQAMYNAQKNSIVNPEAFESALSNATAANPVVYTPYTGYIYVYNLLLGASDTQTALIKEIDADLTDEQKQLERREILASTKIKDLRSSWIYSGYDFDYATKKFTGDYAFLDNSLPFMGEVSRLREKTETESAVYKIESVKEFGLTEFLDEMDKYLYYDTYSASNAVKGSYVDSATSTCIYREYKNDDGVVAKDYDKKINELLFAFSTDSGSLNTYKGYLVTPEPDIGGEETYVKEFAEAGRKFITDGFGKNSYMVVGTDYGYHVMFFSQTLSADTTYDGLVKYLNAVSGENKTAEEWTAVMNDIVSDWKNADTSSYLYKLIDLYSNATNVLTEKQNALINTYKNDTKYVVKYADRYADLLNI